MTADSEVVIVSASSCSYTNRRIDHHSTKMATPRASLTHTRQDSISAGTPAPATAPSHILSAPRLPPPDTFDFLPPLYGLLRRLQQPSGIDVPSGAQDGSGTALPEGSQQQLERVASGGSGKLDISNLDTAASAIRLKIQKAKHIVANMPDAKRTVEEQEEEVAELEVRVERQRAMLRKLGVDLEAQQRADGT